MANEVKKIMGMDLKINFPEGLDEHQVNSAIDYANEKYNEVLKYFELKKLTATSNIHRAIAILKIVMELQTIKGNQAVFLDRNTKKVNDLIKKIDRLGLTD